jgi:hypothetical protein
MEEKYILFIDENIKIFTTQGAVDAMTRDFIYNMYNKTFNTNKKPTGCSRCWRVVKQELYKKYLESK